MWQKNKFRYRTEIVILDDISNMMSLQIDVMLLWHSMSYMYCIFSFVVPVYYIYILSRLMKVSMLGIPFTVFTYLLDHS